MASELSASSKKLDGKVAIITGGASGIGEATARCFAENGAGVVVIADVQDEKGETVALSIGSDVCTYVHCDVTDENQVKSLVQFVIQKHGRLDVMFSNAGVGSASGQTVLDLDLPDCNKLLAINIGGMAACVKHAARVMVEKGTRGCIICTTSVCARVGGPIWTDYTMSKHAVLGLVRCASTQLGAHGIRVNSVSPGAVGTPLLCNSLGINMEQADTRLQDCMVLMGAAMKTIDVAKAVVFLACDEAAFITGLDFAVDGAFKF